MKKLSRAHAKGTWGGRRPGTGGARLGAGRPKGKLNTRTLEAQDRARRILEGPPSPGGPAVGGDDLYEHSIRVLLAPIIRSWWEDKNPKARSRPPKCPSCGRDGTEYIVNGNTMQRTLEMLSDRGWGRPAQTVNLPDLPRGFLVDLGTLTPEEWEKAWKELVKKRDAAGGPGPGSDEPGGGQPN